MIQIKDTKTTILSQDDIYLVGLYSQLNYGLWTKGRASQFEEKQVNPNMIGILGELAFYQTIYPDSPLSNYLKARPKYQSDNGDFELENGSIIDVKTQIVHKGVSYLIEKDTVLANVESKHLQKDYITHFVFVVYDPTKDWLYIMGYMSKDDLLNFSHLYKKGERNGNFIYKQDTYSVAYRYLNPINELIYGH